MKTGDCCEINLCKDDHGKPMVLPKEPDLLPCPFCASKAEFRFWHITTDCFVSCTKCKAHTKSVYGTKTEHAVHRAAKIWNKRILS